MGAHSINKNWLTLEAIDNIVANNKQLELSEESIELVKKCRVYLDHKLANNNDPIYGINTGFGALCDTEVSESDL